MNKKYLRSILIIGLFLLLVTQVDAQCAMCKLNAEDAAKENKGFAEGLNTGILYLMGIPYGLMVVAGFVFFRKLLKRDEKEHSIGAVKNSQNQVD